MKHQSNILIHIPHASLHIPPDLYPDFIPTDLTNELLLMTDRYCDELFNCGYDILASSISRLVVDMERFREDDNEEMSHKGMGAVYVRCSDGSRLRSVNMAQREKLLQTYYDPYHQQFTKLVTQKIEKHGSCLIIDGHSFSPIPLPMELDQTPFRPDFCIGTDEYHTPPKLVKLVYDFIREQGYEVKLNSPFSGAIVPLACYRKNPNVCSLMIEINRRLYMDKKGYKNLGFNMVKNFIDALIQKLQFWSDDMRANKIGKYLQFE